MNMNAVDIDVSKKLMVAVLCPGSKVVMKNNLISLTDQTSPGANTYFDNPARDYGSQKWVDFIDPNWHVDCARKMSLNSFVSHYQKLCSNRRYSFSRIKDEEIYGTAKELIPVCVKPYSRPWTVSSRQNRTIRCICSWIRSVRKASLIMST